MEDVLNLDIKRDATRWTTVQPRSWKSDDVLDFVFHQAKVKELEMATFRGENYKFDGQRLCSMTREEFIQLGGKFGEDLHTEVQKLINQWDNSIQANTTWKCQHPENWSTKEVLDWIFFVIAFESVDLKRFPAEQFNEITGRKLCKMRREEFMEKDPEHGEYIYNMLMHLLGESKFVPPDSTITDVEDIKVIDYPLSVESNFYEQNSENFSTIDSRLFLGKDPSLGLNYGSYIPATVETYSVNPLPSLGEKRGYQNPQFWPTSSTELLSLNSHPAYQQIPAIKRSRLDSPSSTQIVPSSQENVLIPDTTSKNKSGSKTRLWKFMWDLLNNPAYNPEYIRWESKKDGIFRIVSGKSKDIAALWGKIKNNPRMTFDKLGRSLRWCRANNGLFSAIPKNGVYPKKLCFRFKTSQMEELSRTC